MTRSDGWSSTDLTLPGDGVSRTDTDPETLSRGAAVGRYVVVAPLGHGSMGIVYGAYDPDLDRKVALKLLRSDSASAWTRRLAEEAKVMAKISHRSVVAVYDVGDHGGRMFIAMEFVDGTTLREWLRSGPSQAAIVAAFARAGRGLYAAHQEGLVHRDFKPDNVMVQHEGANDAGGPRRVQVLDFGLAHAAAADNADGLESTGEEIGGTPAYMAPEVFGRMEATAASDQFSFCAALFEALTGERPFAGGSLATLAASVTNGELQTPAALGELPRWLRRALTRGLETDPSDRWPSMDALLQELERDRKRAKRVGVAAVAVGVAVVSTLGYQEVQQRRQMSACAEDGAAVTLLWNDTRAAEIERVLLETDLPFASDSWTRSRPALDAFAQSWSDATTDVCVSAKVEDTAPHYELATDCLEEARITFSALLDQLDRGGVSSATKLVENVHALRDPRTCLDPAELSRRAVMPTSKGERDAVAKVRFDIAEVTALLDVGRHAEARELAENAVTAADQVAWPTAAAQARLALAAAANELGDHETALALEQEAVVLAGAAGDDTTALKATQSLMFTLAWHLYRPAEALQLQHHAQMLARRARLDDDDPRSTQILNSVGVAYFVKGEHDQARHFFREFVGHVRSQLGTSHPKVAAALSNLAVTEGALGNEDTALEMGEEIIAIRTVKLGATHPNVASALSTMGGLLSRAGRHDEAIEYLERAVKIRTRVFGGDSPQVADLQNNIVSSFLRLDRNEEAVELAAVVLAARRRHFKQPHAETAGALQNLAVGLRHVGRFEEATAAARESQTVTAALFGTKHPRTLSADLTLASALLGAGNAEQGIALYRRVVETAGTDPDLQFVAADARLSLASAERTAGRDEQTLALCKEVETILTSSSQVHELGAARLCIAGALWRLNRDHAEAIALVRSALETLDPDEAEAPRAWLETARADGPPPPNP